MRTQRNASPFSFSQTVNHMVDRAVQALQLDARIASAVKACNAVLQVTFPVEIKGKVEVRKRGVTVLPDAYVNAGGVTVSYFEWIRNLSHIRFGRMERRYDEMRGQHVITAPSRIKRSRNG